MGKKSHEMGREWKRKKGRSVEGGEKRGKPKPLKFQKKNTHIPWCSFTSDIRAASFVGGRCEIVASESKRGYDKLKRGTLF